MWHQNPIGRSSRSNPVTYLKASTKSDNFLGRNRWQNKMDFTPAIFPSTWAGGRCGRVLREGTITVEMQFMADIQLECESCHGKRFSPEVLEIEYRGLPFTTFWRCPWTRR